MMKILINLVILSNRGINVPWLSKYKRYQELGAELYIQGGVFLEKVPPITDIYNFNDDFVKSKIVSDCYSTKIGFIIFAVRRNLLALFSLKTIKNSDYQVIISPSAVLDLVFLSFIVKLLEPKIVWVLTFDNLVPLKGAGNKVIRFLAWIFFKFSLFLIRRADKIFVVSEDLELYLLQNKFRKDQIIVTTNGVENNLIRISRRSDEYNIDALFVGRINESKGIFDMLKVLNIVKKIYPNFKLAIMGEGDKTTMSKFNKEILKMNLKNNVEFIGYKNGIEKFNIIKSSKCFLSLSESESFGVALLEAACCGVPAFAYRLAPFEKIYKNNEVMLFNKGDYISMALKIIDMFDTQQFDNKAGELLLDKYSWDKIAETEFRAINSVIN